MVAGATVDDIVHRQSDTLLPRFIAAARDLAAHGCIGIATTCGFLARWQRELASALDVPVLTSALLQIPMLAQTLPRGSQMGIVTYSATELDGGLLAAVGALPLTPVEAVDPDGYFARVIRHGAATLDRGRMAQDVVDAARRLKSRQPELGAIVLECANMPPYRAAVAAASGLPVFDAVSLIDWFYNALASRRAPASRAIMVQRRRYLNRTANASRIA